MNKKALLSMLFLCIGIGMGVGTLILHTGSDVTRAVEEVKQTATTEPVTVETNIMGDTNELGKITVSIVTNDAKDAQSVDKLDFIIKDTLINYLSGLTKEEIQNTNNEEKHKQILKQELEKAMHLKIKEVMITELSVVTQKTS